MLSELQWQAQQWEFGLEARRRFGAMLQLLEGLMAVKGWVVPIRNYSRCICCRRPVRRDVVVSAVVVACIHDPSVW